MKRTTLIIAFVSLLLVASTAAWKFLPRTLSYDECSDVYRHFTDMQLEGVHVTFIRDKMIGDTLRLPVTVLQAETDEGWKVLDSLFGRSRQIEEILNNPDLPDSVKQEFLEMPFTFYGYRAHRETPEKKNGPGETRTDDLMVYVFLNMRCVTIYEPIDTKDVYRLVSGYAINSQQEINQEKNIP